MDNKNFQEDNLFGSFFIIILIINALIRLIRKIC